MTTTERRFLVSYVAAGGVLACNHAHAESGPNPPSVLRDCLKSATWQGRVGAVHGWKKALRRKMFLEDTLKGKKGNFEDF